jgi:RNA polymerase sigma factor (sigma-70 family)
VDAALRRVLTTRDQEYEDLLQSALEAVLAAMCKNEFRGEASLSTWASTIARNVAIDALRARSRERRVFNREADPTAQSHSVGPNPERLADARQRLALYDDALWRLRPTKAEVVYLYDVLGYRLDEIAMALGISVAATQSRLVRGRKELGDLVVSLERREPEVGLEEGVPPSGRRPIVAGALPRKSAPVPAAVIVGAAFGSGIRRKTPAKA